MKFSDIYYLYNDGRLEHRCLYSLNTSDALIAYLKQLRSNYNTWEYPTDIEGIYFGKNGCCYYNCKEFIIVSIMHNEEDRDVYNANTTTKN